MNIDKFAKHSFCCVAASLFIFSSVLASDNKKTDNTTARVERTGPMSSYKDVQDFIKETSKKHKINEKILTDAFRKTTFDYSAIDLMEKPMEKRSWDYYSKMLLSTERIDLGNKYIKKYSKILTRISKKYDVPYNVITAIIGIESTYGSTPFKRTAIQSIGTIAFEYPRRSQYFKSELENIFLLAKKEKIDPLTYYGSYAGAIGIAQFMPSNIIRFGQDGDGDGHIDIVKNHADAMASIANYMVKHGWKTGKETIAMVKLNKFLDDAHFANNPCETGKRKTVRYFKELGVIFEENYKDNETGVLIKIDDDEKFAPAIFFENSCPIYKYNASIKYTAAIALLAKKYTSKI